MNEQLENKQGLLLGALSSYIDEQVADKLRSKLDKICEIVANRLGMHDDLTDAAGMALRIDALEKKVAALCRLELLDCDQLVSESRIDALEKRFNKTHDEVCPATRRIRDLAQEEIRRHLDSDDFCDRLTGIVDDVVGQQLQDTNFVGTLSVPPKI